MIKINNNIWNIAFVVPNDERLLLNNKLRKAVCVYKERKILVSRDITKETFKHIIRHELTHSIIYETQLTLKDYYSEEELCEFVGKYGQLLEKLAKKVEKYFNSII